MHKVKNIQKKSEIKNKIKEPQLFKSIKFNAQQ